jgi:hypothetical protein
MKKFKLSIAYLAVFAMIFTSCSKEETGGADLNSEKATVSFGAIVNDLVANRAASKQAIADLPECTDDTPSYVEIVLMLGDDEVVGTSENPYRVDLVTGQLFTEEDAELELDPGNYTLDHFSVYNDDGDLIWLAPRTGSALGEFVTNPLPLAIDLRAGVKKYVDVPVLCFDDRDVNEYGYLFFELDAQQALPFCFFLNYCPPNEDGRHYTANYSVTIWAGTNSSGTPIYTDVEANTGQYDNGDYYATPTCFALPDNDNLDEDYLYYEITLLDWPGNYGTVAPNTVMAGTLSKQDILDNYDGPNNVDYEHLAFGCPTIPGGDDPNDGSDPGNGNGDNGNGDNGGDNGDGGDWPPVGDDCETAFMAYGTTFVDLGIGTNWGWAYNYSGGDGTFSYNLHAAAGQNDTTRGYVAGVVTVTVDGEDVTVEIDMHEGYTLQATHIYLDDAQPTTTAPGQYGNTDEDPNTTYESYDLTYSGDGNFWIIVHAETCE